MEEKLLDYIPVEREEPEYVCKALQSGHVFALAWCIKRYCHTNLHSNLFTFLSWAARSADARKKRQKGETLYYFDVSS